MKKILFMALFIGLTGCSSHQTMSAEFKSMDDCLSKIREETGHDLDIVTDKAGDISGFLKGTKLGFQCKSEITGTKGLIVKGWYQVKD